MEQENSFCRSWERLCDIRLKYPLYHLYRSQQTKELNRSSLPKSPMHWGWGLHDTCSRRYLAFFPLTHLPLHWLQFSHRKKLFPSMPFICTSIPTAFALSSASEQSRLHSATHTHTHDTDRSAARKKCVDSRQMKIIHWLNGSQCAVGQSADTLKCASCLLSKRGEIKGEDVDGPWSLFSVPCSQLACQ